MGSNKEPKVVFRIKKLKDKGMINAAMAHNARTRETPNADPGIENIVVKPCKEDAHEAVIRTIGGRTIRKNAVLAVEVVISASPEYFRPNDVSRAGYYEEQRLNDWRQSVEKWIEEKFPYAVSVILHLDESTPHYQIIDVPIDQKGKLNARGKYGGDSRGDLARWQDWAAECVAHLRIRRGIRGSRAEHVELKKYYSQVKSPAIDIKAKIEKLKPVKLPSSMDKSDNGLIEFAKNEKNRMLAAIEPMLSRLSDKAQSYDFLLKRVHELETTNEQLAADLQSLKMELSGQNAIAIDEVLDKVYQARIVDKKGVLQSTCVWELPDKRVLQVEHPTNGQPVWVMQTIRNTSAFQLVMHLDSLSTNGAIALLAKTFPMRLVVLEYRQLSVRESENFVKSVMGSDLILPKTSVKTWPKTKRKLSTDYKISGAVLDQLNKEGTLYADQWGRVVFRRYGGGAVVCSLGESTHLRLVGNKKHDGPFVIAGDGEVWICNDPIDAVLIKSRNPDAMVVALLDEQANIHTINIIPEGRQVNLAIDVSGFGEEVMREILHKFPVARSVNFASGQTSEKVSDPDGKVISTDLAISEFSGDAFKQKVLQKNNIK